MRLTARQPTAWLVSDGAVDYQFLEGSCSGNPTLSCDRDSECLSQAAGRCVYPPCFRLDGFFREGPGGQTNEEATAHLDNVSVISFSGLTVDAAREHGAKVLVRGLRAVTDFHAEFDMALMNRNMAPDIESVYKRMKSKGVEIVKEIATDEKLKLKSFFVRAPDNVLVEIVQADPVPEASWNRHVHDHDHK